MHIIDTVIPVFAVILLGYLLRRYNFIHAEMVSGLNRLVYFAALPALLFYKISQAEYDYEAAARTFAVVAGGMVGASVIGVIVAFIMRIKPANIGTFVQGCFRGNLVYVGLPVLLYSLSAIAGEDRARVETIVILVLAMIIPVYNITSVIVLLGSKHKLSWRVFGRIGRELVRNPLIIACVAGVLYSIFFDRLPMVLDRSFAVVGQMAMPLALIAIGATLVRGIGGRGVAALTAAFIKTMVSPAVGFGVAMLIGLGGPERTAAMIFLACPTAVASYVLTDQIGGDKQLAASIVVMSTILSALSLSLVVGYF
jgi:hypothetical protein